MKNLSPHLALIKPRPPRTEADREAEALRFLRSWTRARTRLAIVRLSDHFKTINGPQPQPKNCDCAVPVRCFTDVDGGVLQRCLRCGESNVVERRPGMLTTSKARAAELTLFGPLAEGEGTS